MHQIASFLALECLLLFCAGLTDRFDNDGCLPCNSALIDCIFHGFKLSYLSCEVISNSAVHDLLVYTYTQSNLS